MCVNISFWARLDMKSFTTSQLHPPSPFLISANMCSCDEISTIGSLFLNQELLNKQLLPLGTNWGAFNLQLSIYKDGICCTWWNKMYFLFMEIKDKDSLRPLFLKLKEMKDNLPSSLTPPPPSNHIFHTVPQLMFIKYSQTTASFRF